MRLKPVQDASLIVSWAKDARNKEFFRRFPPVFTWNENPLPMFQGYFFIVSEEDEKLGLVSLNNLDAQGRKVELGLLVLPEVKDKRAVYFPVLCEVADYTFDYLQLNKIFAHILPHRESLKQFMLANGFQQEANLRDNVLMEGTYFNELLLGLTKSDWKSRNGSSTATTTAK